MVKTGTKIVLGIAGVAILVFLLTRPKKVEQQTFIIPGEEDDEDLGITALMQRPLLTQPIVSPSILAQISEPQFLR